MTPEEDQALAVTVGLLLLIGGTLLVQQLVGTWPTLAVGVVLVTGGYAARPLAHEVAVRRFARQLRRY
ncbi:hypothetical protein [Streptomyces sp. NPDC048224]|uniref:hypothetical protein n=1 Tax=Streptomyces sp. NPDC048224 TaxID=3154500 RepID=UPI0033C7CD01